jgi:hypothetical protein
MWMYPGPSYPDCSISEELCVVEVEAWIHNVLDLVVNLNSGAGTSPRPGPGPVPLRTGIACIRVSTLGPILASFMILSFHCTHDLA